MSIKDNPKVIADTCIWIEFFRTKSKTSNHLKNLIFNNRVVGAGIIVAELLQGVRTNKARDIVIDTFNSLEYVETTRDLWIASGILAKELRSKGKTVPLSDIIIACCAKKNGYQVFTIDKHFSDIPGINLFKR